MHLSDVHMHHWRKPHFAAIEIPQHFSPLDEYPMDTHLRELHEIERIQVDLVICVQLSLTDSPEHVLDAIDGTESVMIAEASGSVDTREARRLGIVAASPGRLRDGSLDHPRVAGVRLMLGSSGPEALTAEGGIATAPYKPLLEHLRASGRHLTTNCSHKETAVQLLDLIPPAVSVGFDHLGLGHGETDPTETGFRELLRTARERGNVYFKGPGYRTSLDPQRVAPMIAAIIEECGPESVLLGATDAPHVWNDPDSGDPLRLRFPHQTRVIEYLGQLSKLAVATVGDRYAPVSEEALLSDNALAVYRHVL